MAYKNILALFGKPATDTILVERACGLAAEDGARVTFLHINEHDAGAISLYGRVTYSQRLGEADIRALVDQHNPGQCPVEILIRESDDLVGTVVGTCSGKDLLVLGHEHQNLMTRLLSDSLDEHIINSVPCDVLVVHCG